jgi:uncharacterized protein (DUF1800 family)
MATSSPTAAWVPYVPSDAAPWDRRRVVHLHRRAAFAASPSEIERDLADGPAASIDRLLAGKGRSEASPEEFETMAKTIGDAAQASGSADRLKAWWLYRMLMSPDPLTERLALNWHNHFATSNRKVEDLGFMRQQNDVFRRLARAPFGELLTAVVKHPAMLVWLDADSNRAGHPNENLARELMELFTLGIGNYTEDDVKGAARALTGWSVGKQTFRYVKERHDDGDISFLGRKRPLTGDEVLQMLLERPATARRISMRLSKLFFGEGVLDEAAMDELADGLRDHGLDVFWAVQTMLRSEAFFSESNLRSRILGPVEFAVGAIHALALSTSPPSTLQLGDWIGRMGQELFYPPNVGGWPEGRAWLGSRSLVARANFAAALTAGRVWHSPAAVDLSSSLHERWPDAELNQIVRQLAETLWGEALEDPVAQALAAAEAQSRTEQLPAALTSLLTHPEAHLG